MTIRNPEFYMEGVWDWNILSGCFGNTRIEPTDIDGCVERKGRKLFLETKQPGTPIPLGQEITFSSMADDGNSVIVIWGKKNAPERIRLITPFDKQEKAANLEVLRNEVARWFADADGEQFNRVSPERLARVLHKRRGSDFCDTLIAELVRLDEQENAKGRK